jgi:hypothetical protein
MQTDGDTGWRQVEGSTKTRKEHNLNQQQDLDLEHKLNMADSETEICKGYGTNGCRTGIKYGYGLWDKCKTLKLGNKCEPDGITLALNIT